jgi:hypothetical protein
MKAIQGPTEQNRESSASTRAAPEEVAREVDGNREDVSNLAVEMGR